MCRYQGSCFVYSTAQPGLIVFPLRAQSDPSGLPAPGSKPGGYVPPSRRSGAGGGGEGDSMRRREENSVRVTNLSEDTREDDLRVRLIRPQFYIDQWISVTSLRPAKPQVSGGRF